MSAALTRLPKDKDRQDKLREFFQRKNDYRLMQNLFPV
jgi:hypothetical protein